MWETPPIKLAWQNNDIHIWLANLNDFSQYLHFFSNCLSADELVRANKYKGEHLQHNFIINRGILRTILAKYLSINPQQIKFNYSSKGKPFIANSNEHQIKFNLSHKNNYSVYAVSQSDVGIDIEGIKSNINIEGIAQRFFSPQEYQDLCQCDHSQKLEYFFQLWTAKEAYLKAIGAGLSGGLNTINLQKNNSDQTWQIKIVNASDQDSQKWQITTFKIMNDYFVSLATNIKPDLSLKYYLVDSLFLKRITEAME